MTCSSTLVISAPAVSPAAAAGQRQHLLDLRGFARPRQQDRRRNTLPLTAFRVDTAIVDTRRPHLDRADGRGHLVRAVIAVAHHQSVPVLIAADRRTGRSRPRPRRAAPRPASAAHPHGQSHRSPTTTDPPTRPQRRNHRRQPNQGLRSAWVVPSRPTPSTPA